MISQTEASSLLNAACGKSAITQKTNVYLGVCSSEPGATDGAIIGEPTTCNSYARKLVGGSKATTEFFSFASGGIITNGAEIQMSTAREEWGMQYWWFLSTAASGGTAFLWGKLKASDGTEGIAIKAETVPVFYEGQLKASIDVALS